MYKITDKIIAYLNRQLIMLFSKAKSISNFDELNVINYSKEMFEKIDKLVKKALLRLARRTYKDTVDKADEDVEDVITMEWLTERLEQYDPTTTYRYDTELERKRQRFAEGLIASEDKVKEVDKSLKGTFKMMAQYAIEVTDSAKILGYKDTGVKKVVWMTQNDDRVCKVCKKRRGKIYAIDRIPPKAHFNCRCYYLPVD